MTLEIGERVLDRYIVEGVLGRGGMGEVHRGRHERLGLVVALKILTNTSADLEKRFEREAQLMARVRHPNIVAILDFGQTGKGLPVIAMEFIDGEELGARLRRLRVLPWPSAVHIVRGVLAGLAAMHAANVLHRDLKPANIVIAPGTPELVKIIDFGIARPTEGNAGTQLTSAGAVIGTPAYMAPEQLLGYAIDARADLYAAGLMLFELLTGGLPHAGPAKSGQDMSGVLRRLQQPPPAAVAPNHMPQVPRSLQVLLAAALATDPALRPPTAADFIAALDRVGAEPVARAPSSPVDVFGETMVHTDGESPISQAIRQSQVQQPQAWQQPPPQSAQGPTLAEPWPRPSWLPPQEPTPQPVEDTYRSPSGGFAPHTQTSSVRPIPPSGTHAVAPVAEGVRYLVAAKLPPSRLQQPEERRWLAGMLGTHGRSFTLGQQFWFALQLHPMQTMDSGKVARELLERLTARYGQNVTTRVRLVDGGFSLTPAQLTGAQPLPDTLSQMLSDLTGA